MHSAVYLQVCPIVRITAFVSGFAQERSALVYGKDYLWSLTTNRFSSPEDSFPKGSLLLARPVILDGLGQILADFALVGAPSALPFAEHYPMPRELSRDGIQEIVAAFAEAARRAYEAGFRVLEIHAVHGYLKAL
jgi:NADH:flavin oxidoreductase / NADH oxidase family